MSKIAWSNIIWLQRDLWTIPIIANCNHRPTQTLLLIKTSCIGKLWNSLNAGKYAQLTKITLIPIVYLWYKDQSAHFYCSLLDNLKFNRIFSSLTRCDGKISTSLFPTGNKLFLYDVTFKAEILWFIAGEKRQEDKMKKPSHETRKMYKYYEGHDASICFQFNRLCRRLPLPICSVTCWILQSNDRIHD